MSPRAIVALILLAVPTAVRAGSVERWGRHIVSLPNASYSGNPFELEVEATFTHAGSGTQIVLPGFYAGGDTWKIGFMPTEVGEWSWTTSSSDADLDGVVGSITCTASSRRGLLAAEGRKWRYSNGDYVVPIGVFTQLMHGAGSASEVEAYADFLRDHNIHLVNFRLCEADVCFDSVGAKTMDLTLWDRLEERLGTLADRGIGVDVMLYTDDDGKPSFDGQSEEEQFLVRYAVARLAGFPVVLFNSGIDIWEYRDSGWHDWYGDLVKSLDPYGHPVSSRGSTGSDTSFMSEAVRTYNSNGARNSEFDRMLGAYNAAEDASANNDNFGEERSGINGHTPGDIRRTGWKGLLAGGVGFHVRHNVTNDCIAGESNCDNPFTIAGIATQLDSEQWLELVQQFTDSKLSAVFASLAPESALVGNGLAIADPARTTIVYLYMGVNDTWDDGSVDPLEVRLTGLSGSYEAAWFDTRTGAEIQIGSLSGGSDYDLTPPTTDDWILLLTDESLATRQLAITPPTGGTVTSHPAGIECGADCQEPFLFALSVALFATPDYGFELFAWGGDSDCLDGEVLMTADITCSAQFDPCSIESIVQLPSQSVTGSATFEACNELRVGSGGFVLEPTADVIFRAGNLHVIGDGLVVEAGATARWEHPN